MIVFICNNTDEIRQAVEEKGYCLDDRSLKCSFPDYEVWVYVDCGVYWIFPNGSHYYHPDINKIEAHSVSDLIANL